MIVLKGLDDRLDNILRSTYYQMIYQEQVTEIAMVLAGYDAGQADMIRKTIGRKIQSELDELIPKLIQGFINYGKLSEEKAHTLAEAVQACGSYLFNKAHSVEYSLIAYQTAYLKANYPLQYMCALLNANNDDTDKIVKYINECKSMNIPIYPPDVKVGNMKFVIENNGIRIGLTCIKHINKIEIIPSDDIYELFTINKFDKTVKENLIKSGALDSYNHNRNQLYKIAFNIQREIDLTEEKISKFYDKIDAKTAEIAKSKAGTQKVALLQRQIERLKNNITETSNRLKELKDNQCNKVSDYAQDEIETLGFTLRDEYEAYNTGSYSIYNVNKTIKQIILGKLINFKKIKDKRGRDMAFAKIIPYKCNEPIDCVMFSNYYKELKNGVYGFVIREKNQLVGVEEAKKNRLQ